MPWNPNQVNSEILAVHAALVPNGPQGEVVLFGGDEHWGNQAESAGNNSWKKTRVYDVAGHQLVTGQVQSPDSDVFCSHHVFVGDGRLLIAGGTSEWPADGDGHVHGLDFLGHSRCWLYSPRQRRWVETTRLNRNPGQPNTPRSGGRWYPGLVALGDGSALALFGHLDRDDTRHRNNLPERYIPGRQFWQNLPAVLSNPGEPGGGGRRYLFFARGYVLPSGKVFLATPMPVNFATTAGGADGAHFSTALDVGSGVYTTPRAATADGVDGDWTFPSVLLPLLPRDGQYNARILFWAGIQPRIIDTDATAPDWVNTADRVASVKNRNRIYGQAILLPTGQVCMVGGMHVVGKNADSDGPAIAEDPMLQVETYTPSIDWNTNTYSNAGGAWALDVANAAHARNYHSSALLLPNGKVWVGGGNVKGQSGDPATVGIRSIELYEPAYIAVPGRIAIQSAPPLLTYGNQFEVGLDRAATNVARVAIIRNSSVTHSTDNDQRYVGIEIVSRSGNSIQLRMPPNGNVAPPGYYMLWVVDTSGNPCQLARFVRVAHLSCRVVADRSTFSEEEVQALGGGSNARFSSSLYVDFDGFLDQELTGIPTPTLEWSNGGAIPSSQMRLQFVNRYNETNPPNPDVPTRIVFAFDTIFDTMAAFSGWLDNRDVVVRFTLGSQRCESVLRLSKSPNPYMIDIDPAVQNPAWLSTDVRVFKLRPFQTRLGVTLNLGGNGPWTYIRGALDRLRSGAESFNSLPIEGNQATLDGAYMSGWPPLPTFNFAIARVRYRATATVATNVRCFFRLCNVAATGLDFDTNVTYRRTPGTAPVPLLGVAGGQLVSIPFTNAGRVASVMGQPGAMSMTAQTLDPTYDIQNITPNASGAEVTAYFGVYLDINLPTKRFPINPGGDGPFTESASLPIRDLLRSWHNCLVAEIFFDPDPTRPGAGPSDSDNLSQRNLAIIGLENPGLKASRTAMHTFEIAPSKIKAGEPLFSPVHDYFNLPSTFAAKRHERRPDEIFFDWHNLPRDTQVTLYFSDLDTAEISAMLQSRISPPVFSVLDQHTLRFNVGDCAWLPLPGGREIRIPALISIALPDGIVEGQVYQASIRQVDGQSGRIIGSITIQMPVSKAAYLRPEAERQLSFIGHIAKTLVPTDRWYPLFEKLTGYLAERVDALGGDSRQVEPNADGTGKPFVPIDWKPDDAFPENGFSTPSVGAPNGGGATGAHCRTDLGYWISLVVALSLLAFGALALAPGLVFAAIGLIVTGLLGKHWQSLCPVGFFCRLLSKISLGAFCASGIMTLGLVLYGPVFRLDALLIATLIGLIAVLIAAAKGCRGVS